MSFIYLFSGDFYRITSHDDVCHEEAHAAASRYADQTWDHEAMIEDIFADACRAGTIEADARQV